MVQTVSKTVDTAEFRRRGVQTPMATIDGGELTQHGAYGAALTQHAVQSELAVVLCSFFIRLPAAAACGQYSTTENMVEHGNIASNACPPYLILLGPLTVECDLAFCRHACTLYILIGH